MEADTPRADSDAGCQLAKLGRCTGVLALTPAGFWLRHSPLSTTDIGLRFNWRVGQLLGPVIAKPLQTRIGRQLRLRQISARPGPTSRWDRVGGEGPHRPGA